MRREGDMDGVISIEYRDVSSCLCCSGLGKVITLSMRSLRYLCHDENEIHSHLTEKTGTPSLDAVSPSFFYRLKIHQLLMLIIAGDAKK